jgi:hypothetical protein
MVKPMRRTNGWDFIPKEQKAIIKDSLKKIIDPTLDRRDYLDILFSMYNLYMGGTYKDSSKTCGSCVKNVINTFQRLVSEENGQ